MDGRSTQADRDEFHALVERHARALFRLAYRMTGSDTDAEELVQETFRKAWKQKEKFDGRASFGTWLHRICANCALDFLRARRRHREATVGSRDDETPALIDSIATLEPSPERLAQS